MGTERESRPYLSVIFLFMCSEGATYKPIPLICDVLPQLTPDQVPILGFVSVL